jgi:hypothetical protein
MDLTSAYADQARSVHRVFELADQRTAVVVADTVQADPPADLWWFAHTAAAVEIGSDKRAAILRQHGKPLTVRIEQPAGARFGVMDAAPLPSSPHPAIQEKNEGRRKLFIHLESVTNLSLRVRFSPGPG